MNSNRHPDYFSSTDNESEPPLDSSSSKCTYVLLRVEDLSAREINSNQLPPPPPPSFSSVAPSRRRIYIYFLPHRPLFGLALPKFPYFQPRRLDIDRARRINLFDEASKVLGQTTRSALNVATTNREKEAPIAFVFGSPP